MVSQIYPPKLQLGGASASVAKASYFNLHLSVSGGVFSAKIYDKRDDFGFGVVSFPFFMPPTLEKLKGHIAFGLSVRPYVRYKFD